MSINIYEIRVAPSINSKINLNKHGGHKHSDKEKAIKALEAALQEKGIEYSMKPDGNETKFLNKSGGELAVVVRN